MTRRITRRAFTLDLAAVFGSLALLCLPVSAAQQPASPRRIGVLRGIGGFSPEGEAVQQFRQGLLDAGYAEGRDVVIEWRYADGDYSRVPGLAADHKATAIPRRRQIDPPDDLVVYASMKTAVALVVD